MMSLVMSFIGNVISDVIGNVIGNVIADMALCSSHTVCEFSTVASGTCSHTLDNTV